MIEFAHPWMFCLLLPWGFAVWRMLRTARVRGAVFASAAALFGTIRPGWRQRLCRLLPFTFLLGVLGLITAAAGPRTVLSKEVRSADALAVMMAIDISGSMVALDLSDGKYDVTRLDVVKETFRDFLKARPEDLVGLTTFGSYAGVRSPLTADHRVLDHILSGVEIPLAQDEQLTAVGDGLAVSLLALKEAEPKTRIVILLSDGENNTGAVTPGEAANAAKELGIRVYTIGAGSTGVTKARVKDFRGQEVLVDLRTSLDEKTLREIAETTGGRYANVRSPEQLAAFLETVSKLETTKLERQIYARYRSRILPWLIGGGLLSFLSAALLMALIRRPL